MAWFSDLFSWRRAGARSQVEVLLYTRSGCHLCDEALAILEKHNRDGQLAIRLVDIDQDDELRVRFDTTVPVVEINGTIRFRGRINEVLLRRLLRSTRGG